MEKVLLWAMAINLLGWMVLEVRHSDRNGKIRGPAPAPTRSIFMWVSVILMLAYTFWATQHGTYVYD